MASRTRMPHWKVILFHFHLPIWWDLALMSENQIWRHFANKQTTDFCAGFLYKNFTPSNACIWFICKWSFARPKWKIESGNVKSTWFVSIDLRVILTETPVFSSAPWSSGTRLQHFKLSSFHIHILCWKLPFQTLPEIGKQIIIKQKNEFQRNSYSQKYCLENLKMFCWKMCFVRSFIVKSNCFIRDKASINFHSMLEVQEIIVFILIVRL